MGCTSWPTRSTMPITHWVASTIWWETHAKLLYIIHNPILIIFCRYITVEEFSSWVSASWPGNKMCQCLKNTTNHLAVDKCTLHLLFNFQTFLISHCTQKSILMAYCTWKQGFTAVRHQDPSSINGVCICLIAAAPCRGSLSAFCHSEGIEVTAASGFVNGDFCSMRLLTCIQGSYLGGLGGGGGNEEGVRTRPRKKQ